MPNPFTYTNQTLHAEQVPLADIAAQVSTPCYVYSRARALENLARIQSAFPQAHIHYSLKANANPEIIKMFAEAGIGADAVSGGEIFRAVASGIPPGGVVFAGVGKTRRELEYALEIGVGWINIESAGELNRIRELTDSPPNLALRLNPDIHAATHAHIDTGHAAAKFGLPYDEVAQNLKENPDISGIHVHIGSQIGEVSRTVQALEKALPLFSQFSQLDTLNLGGGFPVSYMGEPVPAIEEFAAALLSLIPENIQLILEPGRSIIADAGALLVEVQYVKQAGGKTIAITDGGMTELIRPALYGAQHQVWPVAEPSPDTPSQPTEVAGPVCESADVLAQDTPLPPLKEGDLLAVMHAGAYAASMGMTYNARPLAAEILVEGDDWRVVRERETWEDM